jgi:Flp pilus assembly protein TadD
MKKQLFYLFVAVFFSVFLQGCGLAGAYIWFGDRELNYYNVARANGDAEKMKKSLTRALDYYNSSLTYDDKRYPDVYIKLADTDYRINSNHQTSIGWLERGLKIAPENGDIHAALGRYTFLKAIHESMVTDRSGRTRAATSSELRKVLDEAKGHYKDALLRDSLSPVYNAGLARVFFYEIEQNTLEGRGSRNDFLFSQVNDLLEAGKSKNPDHPAIVKAEGIRNFLQGNYDDAIRNLADFAQDSDDEEQLQAAYYLTRSYIETNKYQEALALANRVLEKKPDDVRFIGERIIAYFRMGQGALATSDLERMDTITDQYHEFYYRLGLLYHQQNVPVRADLYLLRAYRIDDKNPSYAFALGQNSLLKKDPVQARNFFRRAQQLALPGSKLEEEARHALSRLQ